MERSGRHILLAVEPAVLEGALAKMLSAGFDDHVVQLGRTAPEALDRDYDAAVVSTELPAHIRARVVITLPDTRGGAGTGTIRSGDVVQEVDLPGADRVVQLLEQYSPRPQGRPPPALPLPGPV